MVLNQGYSYVHDKVNLLLVTKSRWETILHLQIQHFEGYLIFNHKINLDL